MTTCHIEQIVDVRQFMAEPEQFDSVAGVFPDSRISEILATVHRQGHGHHARLIRCDGGTPVKQLDRAGVPRAIQDVAGERGGMCVLVIEAPRQTARVADLLLGLGAVQVERFAGPRPVSTVLSFDASVLEGRSRRRSTST